MYIALDIALSIFNHAFLPTFAYGDYVIEALPEWAPRKFPKSLS